MAFGGIVSHSDGAGGIEAVGPARAGRRVWVYGAGPTGRSGPPRRPPWCPTHWPSFSRTGQRPDGGVRGHPGHHRARAVFAGGPVCGQAMLVHGVRGSVSSLAAQLARRAGAAVIGAVRTDAETATPL
jgi:NADPH2:quinone reductase